MKAKIVRIKCGKFHKNTLSIGRMALNPNDQVRGGGGGGACGGGAPCAKSMGNVNLYVLYSKNVDMFLKNWCIFINLVSTES